MKKSIVAIIFVLFWSQCLCMAQTKEAYSLKSGAAKIDITPKNQPTAPATGKYDHERAYVRAIVLDNDVTRAALISVEGSLNNDSWASVLKQITSELKCPVENIIISTTHSHSLGMGGGPAPGPQGTAVVSTPVPQGTASASQIAQPVSPVADSIIKAVRQAKARLQPALMGFGKGTSYLNVNRDAIDTETRKWTQAYNLDGNTDKSVDVIKFVTPDGKPIAAYVNYAMHPVNGYVIGIFSADFPGALCRYVEKAFGDEMITVFCQGASGDQNPLYLRPSTNAMASRSGAQITGYDMNRESIEAPLRSATNPPMVGVKELENLFRMMESEGQMLGEEVIRVMTVTTKMTGNVRIAGAQKTVTCPGRTRTNTGREGTPGEYKDGPDVNHHLGILGLGTTVIATSDGEIFSYIGLQVKKESPLTNTMFVELANGGQGAGPGYVPNDAAYGEQTFQVLGARDKEGCAERAIVNEITDMVTDYFTRK
jgi:neutral ceramidase